MPDAKWKRVERNLGTILDGIRIPANGFGEPDVIAGTLAVEAKDRKSFPQWIFDAVDQSKINAKPGMMPVLVLHHSGRGKKSRWLAVVELEELIGEG